MAIIENVGNVVLQLGRMDEEGARVWVCRVRGTNAVATGQTPTEAAREAIRAVQKWADRGKVWDIIS